MKLVESSKFRITPGSWPSVHPEFTSTPRDGHALLSGFVKAASEYQKRQRSK
ncbi:hypothetical protein ACNKHU_16805 [Shigella flexneri]